MEGLFLPRHARLGHSSAALKEGIWNHVSHVNRVNHIDHVCSRCRYNAFLLPSGALAAKNPTCSRSVLLLLLLSDPLHLSLNLLRRGYFCPLPFLSTIPLLLSTVSLSWSFAHAHCSLHFLHSNFCRGLWRLDPFLS